MEMYRRLEISEDPTVLLYPLLREPRQHDFIFLRYP